MTSFQLPSAFFPDNPVTRAERIYQQRSNKPLRLWRRWINGAVKWLCIMAALLMFGGLFIASLTQRDPTPLIITLNPLPALLFLVAVAYHFSLLFQTITFAANSITREKEAQTWDMLVLTGIDARQIVRGKWWATVQRQLPHYLLLGLLRAGALCAIGIRLGSGYFVVPSPYYQGYIQLPHPVTIIITTVLSVAFSLANLGFSAACGIMGSAVSKRGAMAMLRGIANQIVLSLLLGIGIIFLLSRFNFIWTTPIYSVIGSAAMSLIDNGLFLTSYPMNTFYNYRLDAPFSPYTSIEMDWMAAGLLTLALYAALIWFALWLAERRAVNALATPPAS